MKIGVLKRIAKEDLSKLDQVPKWIDVLIYSINQFMTTVATALTGRLTFQDNFLCDVKTVKMKSDVEQEILVRPNTKVLGVVGLDFEGNACDKLKWVSKSNGGVGLTVSFDPPTAEAQSTFLILYK